MEQSTNKTKTMWKFVKPEINKQESNDNFPQYIEGNLVKDYQELASKFNEYFINVTTNAFAVNPNNGPPAINNLYSVYREVFPQIIMAPVTTKEIKYIIKSLPWKNSSGYDDIPLRILKISMPFITSPLTYAINRYLKHISPQG
jgi:hypothetical protein